MGHQIGWGLTLVFAGGLLNGSFAAPMKRLSVWRWENIWLVYSIVGLLILPWAIAQTTILRRMLPSCREWLAQDTFSAWIVSKAEGVLRLNPSIHLLICFCLTISDRQLA